MSTTTTKPSKFALELLEGMRKAATEEVRRHLAEGRSVWGFRDGKLVEIFPNKD